MTGLEKLILDELDDTEDDVISLSGNLMPFGFDSLERGSYQDKLNGNVLNPTGRSRS